MPAHTRASSSRTWTAWQAVHLATLGERRTSARRAGCPVDFCALTGCLRTAPLARAQPSLRAVRPAWRQAAGAARRFPGHASRVAQPGRLPGRWQPPARPAGMQAGGRQHLTACRRGAGGSVQGAKRPALQTGHRLQTTDPACASWRLASPILLPCPAWCPVRAQRVHSLCRRPDTSPSTLQQCSSSRAPPSAVPPGRSVARPCACGCAVQTRD